MTEHLSSLQLDELAAGLAPEPPHLADCAECRARLDALRAARAAFAQHPDAARVLWRLTDAPAPIPLPRRRLMPLVAAGALALAAGLVLILQQPFDDETPRLKGAPTVELLDETGAPVTRAKVGQSLTLAVGGAGAQYAAVFAEEPGGARTLLWPQAGATLAPLEPGARVRLRQLEVTPGAVTVRARFGETPAALDAAGLVEATVRLEVE